VDIITKLPLLGDATPTGSAEGKVFVIPGRDSSSHVALYALDAASGNTLWGPVQISEGFYWWAATAI